jgi:hypothetical protein
MQGIGRDPGGVPLVRSWVSTPAPLQSSGKNGLMEKYRISPAIRL